MIWMPLHAFRVTPLSLCPLRVEHLLNDVNTPSNTWGEKYDGSGESQTFNG